jgi:putative glutamine amidotransferase
VGIPWRTTEEQHQGKRDKLNFYFEAVRKAGAEPQEVSLEQSPDQLARQLEQLDAFVLPGSPADVDPSRYGAARHPKTNTIDANRDATDSAILAHAFRASKPVLAICYGCQNLNVTLGGTLYQDIPSELHTDLVHSRDGLAREAKDPVHAARIEPGGELGQLAAKAGLPMRDGGFDVQINTSHHQSIRGLGHGLRVAAVAPDGVIEAVEHEPHKHWVVGVQWHPERMPEDGFAQRLFQEFVAAARAHEAVAQKS